MKCTILKDITARILKHNWLLHHLSLECFSGFTKLVRPNYTYLSGLSSPLKVKGTTIGNKTGRFWLSV